MKLLIHFKGEGRELTVPEPTNEEKRKLLAEAIRHRLKVAVGLAVAGNNVIAWEVVRDTVVEWSLNGYYGKGKDDDAS